MASILKVDTIQDQSGNNIINENADTITIGASGDTITVPTGASLTVPSGGLSGQNYPAFFAYLDLDQTGNADLSAVKINVDTEVFDTDNCYDNTTNYRFTPNVAGKYLFQAAGVLDAGSNTNFVDFATQIYKNGSGAAQSQTNPTANYGRKFTQTLSVVLEANGTTDYFELYSYGDTSDGGTWTAKGQPASTRYLTYFGAFRIGA